MDGVTKLSQVALLAVDEDGTPMHNGERLTEIRPGTWAHPLAVALAEFLERHREA